MSITAKVHRGTVTLPPELNLPDGTEVEIILPGTRNGSSAQPVRLPTFEGDGLQSGVNLDDSRTMRRLLEPPGKPPQLS
jgi:hypothetical protein